MTMKGFKGVVNSIEPLIKNWPKKYFLRFGMKDDYFDIQWVTTVGNWLFVHLLLIKLWFANKKNRVVEIRGMYDPKTTNILLEHRRDNFFKIEK